MGLYLWPFRRLPQDSLYMPICGVSHYVYRYTHPLTKNFFPSFRRILEMIFYGKSNVRKE